MWGVEYIFLNRFPPPPATSAPKFLMPLSLFGTFFMSPHFRRMRRNFLWHPLTELFCCNPPYTYTYTPHIIYEHSSRDGSFTTWGGMSGSFIEKFWKLFMTPPPPPPPTPSVHSLAFKVHFLVIDPSLTIECRKINHTVIVSEMSQCWSVVNTRLPGVYWF